MKKIITLNELPEAERDKVFREVYDKHDKNYHYLAFEKQLTGYTPLNVFVNGIPAANLIEDEKQIFKNLVKKQEVCSFYPKSNLTLYPVYDLENGHYKIDLTNIEKHFADILELNDNVYKTRCMFINFGSIPDNFNFDLIKPHLEHLLEKSRCLETVYIEYLN